MVTLRQMTSDTYTYVPKPLKFEIQMPRVPNINYWDFCL